MRPPFTSPRTPWWSGALWPILVGLGVLAVFWEVRQGQFLLWDDDINIRDNPHLRSLSWEHLRWMLTDTAHMRRYAPLTWLNWALEHALFGLTPGSAHMGNLLLHAINAIFVYALAHKLLRTSRPPLASSPAARSLPAAAALAAALWALHPLRVEPVAWASGRIYGVAAFFLLLSALAYVDYTRARPGTRRRSWLFAGSLGAYLASLLTYPLGLTWVGVLVVLDTWVLRRVTQSDTPPEHRRLWLEKAAFAAIALGPGLVTLWAAAHASGRWEPPVSLADFGLASRLAQALYLCGYYGWRPFWPIDLSPVYPTLIDFQPADWPFVASAGLVVGVTLLLVIRRRQSAAMLALWLCHLCLLVPVLGLTSHPHYPNDRYSYLAALPWCIGAAGLVLRLGSADRRRQRMLLVTGGVVLVALGLLSRRQVAVWRDTETLFRHILAKLGPHPYRADIHRRLGMMHLEQRQWDAAADQLQQALAADPREALAHFGLGQIAEHRGLLPAATESYQHAARLKPSLAVVHVRLGYVLYRLNRLPESATAFLHRLRLQPNEAAAHTDYAAVLLRLGRAGEALPHCQAAARLRPDDAANFLNLGTALAALGRTGEAEQAYHTALRLQPRDPEVHFALGRLARAAGRLPQAAQHFQAALELQPDLTAARDALRQLNAIVP